MKNHAYLRLFNTGKIFKPVIKKKKQTLMNIIKIFFPSSMLAFEMFLISNIIINEFTVTFEC